MIHVGMDVHARNSLLNAKDAPGKVLTPACCGNTMFDRSTFSGPLARRAQASGEAPQQGEAPEGQQGQPRPEGAAAPESEGATTQ